MKAATRIKLQLDRSILTPPSQNETKGQNII